MIRRPPIATLVPYTSLFRSGDIAVEDLVHQVQVTLVRDLLDVTPDDGLVLFFGRHDAPPYREALPLGWDAAPLMLRSEEHTSELQSRQYLVCRLLLEKKSSS